MSSGASGWSCLMGGQVLCDITVAVSGPQSVLTLPGEKGEVMVPLTPVTLLVTPRGENAPSY